MTKHRSRSSKSSGLTWLLIAAVVLLAIIPLFLHPWLRIWRGGWPG
jgi:hypothetical protein